MIQLEEIFAKLGIRVDTASFGQAEGALAKLKEGAKIAAALYAGYRIGDTLKDWIGQTIEHGRQTVDWAARLNLGVEAMQAWQAAGKVFRLENQDLTDSFKTLAAQMQAAAEDGAGSAAKALRAFGITASDIKARDTEGSLLKIADAMQSGKLGAKEMAYSMIALGEGAIKMKPLLVQGRDGIRQLMNTARETGQVISEESIRRLDELGKTTAEVEASVGSLKHEVALGLLPVLEDVAEGVRDWVQENRSLIASGIRTTFEGIARAAYWVYDVFAELTSRARELVEELVDSDGVRGAFEVVRTVLSQVMEVAEALYEVAVSVARVLVEQFSAVWHIMVSLSEILWELLSRNLLFKAGLAAIWVILKALVFTLKAVAYVLNQMATGFRIAGEALSGFLDTAREGFHDAFDWVLDLFESVRDIVDAIGDKLGAAVDLAKDIAWRIRHPLSGARPSGASDTVSPWAGTNAGDGALIPSSYAGGAAANAARYGLRSAAAAAAKSAPVDLGPWAPTINNSPVINVTSTKADAKDVAEEVLAKQREQFRNALLGARQ